MNDRSHPPLLKRPTLYKLIPSQDISGLTPNRILISWTMHLKIYIYIYDHILYVLFGTFLESVIPISILIILIFTSYAHIHKYHMSIGQDLEWAEAVNLLLQKHLVLNSLWGCQSVKDSWPKPSLGTVHSCLSKNCFFLDAIFALLTNVLPWCLFCVSFHIYSDWGCPRFASTQAAPKQKTAPPVAPASHSSMERFDEEAEMMKIQERITCPRSEFCGYIEDIFWYIYIYKI